MYARHPLTQYTDILTDSEWRHFSAKLEVAGEKPDNLSGKNVYDIFTSSLEIAIAMLSRDAGKEQNSTFSTDAGFVNVLNTVHKPSTIDRPCPIEEHVHHLNECLSFWGANSDTRRALARGKLCFTCLGPFSKCIQQCDNPVDKRLICKICSSESPDREVNILFCTRGHSSGQTYKALIKRILHLVPGTPFRWINIKVSCLKYDNTPSKSKHTVTKPEVVNGTALLSQWIKIKGMPHLVFFDTGASANIVSHRFVRDINPQHVSQGHVTFSGVGGRKLTTNLGTYRITLGPTVKGEVCELYCTAMKNVAGKLPELQTNAIQDEVNASAPGHILPEKVRGGGLSLFLLGSMILTSTQF